MPLDKVEIIGVFDRQDITFDFSRSPYFIVGPNGTGKSTSLKLLHCLLTGQWSRFDGLPFVSMNVYADGRKIHLEKSDFSRIGRLRNGLLRFVRRPSKGDVRLLPTTWSDAQKLIKARSKENTKRPPGAILLNVEGFEEDYENFAKISNIVDEHCKGRVLYFPTYRRVERDLGELLESDDDPFTDSPSIAPAVADRFETAGEVVGFGGQDIRRLLSDTAARIEVQARQALNEHSVRFLEAIATRRTEETKVARALIKSSERTDRLLDRLIAFSPSSFDVESVRLSISSLRFKLSKSNPGRLNQQQEMLLFYVSEMINLLAKIDALSGELGAFVEITDKYLKPFKRAVLREADYRVRILDLSNSEIELDDLSSGEKQILAFFAFLFLKPDKKPKYILVDEPELSLSVSWQRTLIEDLVGVNSSTYVLSATHSPFIFENFDLKNVISLGEL